MGYCELRSLEFPLWDVCSSKRLMVVTLLLFGCTARANASFTTFDPPNSISTFPTSATFGEAVGYYVTADSHVHGFIRTEGGITTYDAPNTSWTQLEYVDAKGSIVGNYVNSSNDAVGFMLTSSGQLTSFQYANSHLTLPQSVNAKGLIVGNYENSYGDYAFLRRDSGALVTILPHKSSVYAWAINHNGKIAGYCTVGGDYRIFHGFEANGRTGKIFDPPTSVSTYAWSINAAGTIAGDYWDSANNRHAYIRASDGTITSFDVSQSSITTAASINKNGEIVGGYGASSAHPSYLRPAIGPVTPLAGGYVRAPDGTITTFNIRGAADIAPVGINDNGVVLGWYQDQSGAVHGFAGRP